MLTGNPDYTELAAYPSVHTLSWDPFVLQDWTAPERDSPAAAAPAQDGVDVSSATSDAAAPSAAGGGRIMPRYMPSCAGSQAAAPLTPIIVLDAPANGWQFV